MTIRVFLVDESREVCERLRVLLLHEPDMALVGEAGDDNEALAMLQRLSADVVVMGLNLPEISGIQTAERILADRPATKIIIVSLQSDPNYVKAGFEAGATGYLLKDCAFEELVEAVRVVVGGGNYVSPEIETGVP